MYCIECRSIEVEESFYCDNCGGNWREDAEVRKVQIEALTSALDELKKEVDTLEAFKRSFHEIQGVAEKQDFKSARVFCDKVLKTWREKR